MRERRAISLAILLLAFALWCGRLNRPSFWIDEQIAAEIAGEPDVKSVWQSVARRERRPPGYHLLLFAWRHAAGDTDFALRYPSAAAGVLALAVTMRLARRWVGRRAALRCGILTAGSAFLALYVPMARYYSLAWLLAASSWLTLERWLAESRTWWAYATTTLALMYTDPAVIPVLIGQGIRLHAGRREQRRAWAFTVLALGLATFPWWHILRRQASRDLLRADLSGTITGILLRLSTPWYVWTVGEATLPWQGIAWLGLLAGGLLTMTVLKRPLSRAVLALGVLVPLGFTIGLTEVVAPDITFLNTASRALYAAPALYLVWGAGLMRLRRPLRLTLAAALIVTNLVGLVHLWTGRDLLNPIYAVPSREIAAQVAESAHPGDLFLADRDTVVQRYWPATHPVPLLESRSPQALQALRTRPSHVWLFTLNRDRTRPLAPREAIQQLERTYRRVAEWKYVPLDPTYRKVKARLLRRPAYTHKAVLSLYEAPDAHRD